MHVELLCLKSLARWRFGLGCTERWAAGIYLVEWAAVDATTGFTSSPFIDYSEGKAVSVRSLIMRSVYVRVGHCTARLAFPISQFWWHLTSIDLESSSEVIEPRNIVYSSIVHFERRWVLRSHKCSNVSITLRVSFRNRIEYCFSDPPLWILWWILPYHRVWAKTTFYLINKQPGQYRCEFTQFATLSVDVAGSIEAPIQDFIG